MLEKIEAFVVHHRRLFQALFFGIVEMSGLLLYANANSFQAYTQPQQLPLLILAVTTILIFSCVYVFETTSSHSITPTLMLIITVVVIGLSVFQLPTLINVINILAVVVLCLMRFLPNWFANELGIGLLALLLASLSAGSFLLRHDYLSANYLTTIILPLLTFLYFFLPQHSFQTRWIPFTIALLTIIWLVFTQQSLLLAVIGMVILTGWYLVQTMWRPSPSLGLLVGAILQAILFVFSR